MVCIPTVPVNDCPNCGEQPTVKMKFFGSLARLQCSCGVSGAWRNWNTHSPAWNQSISGWEKVAGVLELKRPPPPKGLNVWVPSENELGGIPQPPTPPPMRHYRGARRLTPAEVSRL